MSARKNTGGLIFGGPEYSCDSGLLICRRSAGEKRLKIAESIRELIAKAPLAHLTTLNSTGGPQVTVVWVGIENEEFVIGHLHLATYQKVKNIRRDRRVSVVLA